MTTRLHPLATALLAAAALTGCSHDAVRDNPFDSGLTPPVQVQAAFDDTLGSAALTWTRYAGDQPFARYLVLRNVALSTVVDTLAEIADLTATAYTDTTLAPDTAYEFRVAVVNLGGFLVPSPVQRVEGYTTRAVRLAAPVPDPATGAVGLAWSRYRDPGFERYRVFRRQAGTDADSVLAQIAAVDDTGFTDTTALHGVDYLYRVVVEAAGRELSSAAVEGRLELRAVVLTRAQIESRTATAALEWTAYAGPRFDRYEVWREQAGSTERVGQIADVQATAFSDSGLVGNTVYTYWVVVRTGRAEVVPSVARGDTLHALVATWGLPVVLDEDVSTEFVRLYREAAGVSALVARLDSTQLLTYGPDGDLIGERQLAPLLERDEVRYEAVAGDGIGGMLESMAGGVAFIERGNLRPATLVRHTAAGPLRSEFEPFSGQVILPPGRTEVPQSGWITLRGTETASVIYRDFAFVSLGKRISRPGNQQANVALWSAIPMALSWRDFALSTFARGSFWEIRVETDSSAVVLATDRAQVTLDWRFAPSDGQPESAGTAVATWPAGMAEAEVRLESVDGVFRVALATAGRWATWFDESITWGSLARTGDEYLLTLDNRAYHVAADDSVQQLRTEFASDIAETRVWQVDGERVPRVGICLPNIDQVHWGTLLRPSVWDRTVSGTVLDDDLPEAAAGSLNWPLSLDGSADGRVFVLDAGNHRVLAFDLEGNYITQWGGRGSGPGRFDFGDGNKVGFDSRNLGGSIAVDGDGFIYVADLSNKRIQKFAP